MRSYDHTVTTLGTIYALCDPESMEIRYVGKTISKPSRRLSSHLYLARNGNHSHLSCWLRSLNEPPFQIVLEVVPKSELDACECSWIAGLRQRGFRLTNGTEGGDGGEHTTAAKAKVSQAMRGRKFTPEWRARLSAAQRRRFEREAMSQETRAKQRAAALRNGQRPPSPKGRKASPQARANMSAAQKGLKRLGETRQCKTCGSDFYASRAEIKRGNGHFCSKSCVKKSPLMRAAS